jgi:hypothetical protein
MATMVRLQEPIIAIHPLLEGSQTLTAIPRYAVLEVVGEPQKSGLVEALWEGQHITVFMRDLESRGELVEVVTTGQ